MTEAGTPLKDESVAPSLTRSKGTWKWLLVPTIFFILGFLAACPIIDHQEKTIARCMAIRATHDWARVAALPVPDKDMKIEEGAGGMFGSSFCKTFQAKPDVIAAWQADSPGLQEAEIRRPDAGVTLYVIKPGGGAQSASVEINEQTYTVIVRACWS